MARMHLRETPEPTIARNTRRLERTKRKGESMEKRAIEKRSGSTWVNINMSELVQGDEFRYADETERSFVVEGAPWVNDKGVWTVEVQDE